MPRTAKAKADATQKETKTSARTEKKDRSSSGAKPQGRPTTYNWSAIRREYIRGDDKVTLESLSHKTGYPTHGTLKNRAAAEDWTELRQSFRDQVMTQFQQVDRDLKVEVKTEHLKVAKAMLSIGVRGMAHLDPAKLEPIDVARFLTASTTLTRKTLGMEELNVRFGKLRSEDDLDKLSREELWQLAALLPPEEDNDEEF